jgi:hypothetical protein
LLDSLGCSKLTDLTGFFETELCEPLRTDSAHDSCQYFRMKKKRKNPIETARTTLSSVKREMQKPRLTESVRNDRRDQAAPVVQIP